MAVCAAALDAEETRLLGQAIAEWSSVKPLLAKQNATTKKVVDAWMGKWGPGRAVARGSCSESRVITPREVSEVQTWLMGLE